MKQGTLSGLVAAAFTPFQKDGALNLSQISTLASLYRANRLGGVFINGTTGEFASLNVIEQKELIEAWQSEKKSLPVGVMLGGTCLKDMQTLALFSAEKEMDAVAMLSPYYFRPKTVEALVEVAAEVATTVPHLPFYYYHIPSMAGGNFYMRDFLALAADRIPNLAGIKFTHSDIMDFQAAVQFQNGRYDLLWGTDEALLSGWVAGARGAIGSTYNYAAPLYHDVLAAIGKGDLEEARQLQLKSVEFVKLLFKYGGAATGKAIMALIGQDCGPVRSPLVPLSTQETQALEQDLQAINFFSYCSQL